MSEKQYKEETFEWRSRRVGSGQMAADQFLFNPMNPKFHPQAQRDALKGVIKTVGQVAPVLVNRTTGYVVDGHERIWLALKNGDKTLVDYDMVELSEDEELFVLATFDPVGMMAQHDREKLAALMHEVESSEAGVQAMLSELAAREKLVLPDAEPPEEFPSYDEDIETEYCCPKCGYEWSGKPK